MNIIIDVISIINIIDIIIIIIIIILREVGVPSRNILHGRGVGSKSRIRVTGRSGSLGAFDSQNTYRNFSLEFLFGSGHAGCI